ncbi:MAG: glycosyltransferase 2 family protein, partial [Actinomycetota bacterium]
IAVVLARRVHLAHLLPHRDAGNTARIGLALALTLVGVVLSAFRWQRVLATLDVHVPLYRLTRHYLASLFVGNFLPSTVGGDVLRVTRLGNETGDSAKPFASVVLERMSGWIVLPALTFIGLGINPTLRQLGSATAFASAVGAATLLALGGVLVAAANPRLGAKLSGSTGWRRFTGAIHLGVDRFRRRPMLALEVIAAGFVYQLCVLLSVFFAAKAIGLEDVGITAIIAFFPVVLIVQTLPVTIGGLGVREGAIYVLLHPIGVTSDQAISLGVVYYAMTLIVSQVGAPAFAAGGARKVAAPR